MCRTRVVLSLLAVLGLTVGLGGIALAGQEDGPVEPAAATVQEGEPVEAEPPAEEPARGEKRSAHKADERPEQAGECDSATTSNHGWYVSCVARTTPPGPGHGQAVSEAAHEKRDAKREERSSRESRRDKPAGKKH